MTRLPIARIARIARIAALALAAAAALAACTTTSPDVVNRYEAQYPATVVDAVVLAIRPVTVAGTQTGLGAMAGSMVGGVAASNMGGGGNQAAVAGMIGFVLGGLLGNAAEHAGTQEEAIEILVQLRNGERRAVVQAKASESIAPGDSVIVISTGGRARVTKAPVVIMPSPPAPAASAGATS